MLNRLGRKIRPMEYWQDRKKQFMAGSRRRNLWLGVGLSCVAFALVGLTGWGLWQERTSRQVAPLPLGNLVEERTQSLPLTQSAVVAKPEVKTPVVQRDVKPPAVEAVQPPNKTAASPARPTAWPVKGTLLYEFGWQQHPVLGDWQYRTGIGIKAVSGQSVVAAMSGVITALEHNPKTGLTVQISSGSWQVYQGALASAAIKPGVYVKAGQVIGTVGEAFFEPEPYTYLAIAKDKQFVDPQTVLP